MNNKFFLVCLTGGITLSIGACTKNNGGVESLESQDNFSSVKVEDGTPQEWIDLFTFTNVTIIARDSLLLKREGREFRCVDSKWYVKEQGEISFNTFNEDPATIYEIAYAHYSQFTYYEEYYYFRAEKMKIDDTDFRYTVTVMYDPNSVEKRIGWLYSSAFLSDSLSTESSLEFKDYGSTELD